MNISTSHTNSGFRSKHVQITYAKLREEEKSVGKLPVTEELYQDWVPDGRQFVASTLENPVGYAGHPSRDLLLKNPVLDAAGRPIMETVTETIEIPGPKRQALSWVADTLGTTAMFGCGVSLIMGGMGALCAAFAGQAPSAGFKVGLMAGAASTAVMTGKLVVAGLSIAKETYSSTNTLTLDPTPIVKKEMLGYDAATRHLPYGDPYIEFKPRLKETHLGEWSKPTIHTTRP